MKLGRRDFGFSMLGALLTSVMMLSGCPSFSSIESDIANYVPFFLQAFTGILALFDPPLAAELSTVSSLVQAAISALITAIANWKAADATQKPGLVGDIIATLETAETTLTNFLAAVKIKAPAFLTIATALINILLGVLESFVNKLEPAVPAALQKPRRVTLVNVPVLNYNSKKFKAVFNAKCVELGHPEAQIK